MEKQACSRSGRRARGPAGDTCAAHRDLGEGPLVGATNCSRALTSLNQSVSMVTVSPASSRRMASSDSSHHVAPAWRGSIAHHERVGGQRAPGPRRS